MQRILCEGNSNSVFLFGKRPNPQVTPAPLPSLDGQGQTDSPEDGVLFVVVIILELVGGAMAISFILRISKTIDPCLSQVLDPLQVILEL